MLHYVHKTSLPSRELHDTQSNTPRMTCRYPWTQLDSNVEVIGDANFCLCGHVAMKSDATAAIGMVHRLGLGKVRHLAVGDLWVQHHVRSGKIRVSKMSLLETPSDAQTKYLGAGTTVAPDENLQIGSLSLMMASRYECRWVVALSRGRFRRSSRTRSEHCDA